MLQDLQYLVGTSKAPCWAVADRTITQSVVGGPIASGSSEGSAGGKGWRLRGRIWVALIDWSTG